MRQRPAKALAAMGKVLPWTSSSLDWSISPNDLASPSLKLCGAAAAKQYLQTLLHGLLLTQTVMQFKQAGR